MKIPTLIGIVLLSALSGCAYTDSDYYYRDEVYRSPSRYQEYRPEPYRPSYSNRPHYRPNRPHNRPNRPEVNRPHVRPTPSAPSRPQVSQPSRPQVSQPSRPQVSQPSRQPGTARSPEREPEFGTAEYFRAQRNR